MVTPGHALEHALCGLVKAAQHRVVLSPGAKRFSVAYKLMPRPDAVVNLVPNLMAAGMPVQPGRYQPPISARELLARFSAMHRSLKAPLQLPAQPQPGERQ